MNKEIEKGLNCIFNSLTDKSNNEISALLEDAIKHLNDSKIKLDNPDNFNCFINHKLKRGVELIANNLHEPSVCRDKNKPNFIYANYSFLEGHIKQLCVLREGSSCCADKARYILKMFLNYSIDGIIPEFDPTLEKYWIPNFGDNQMWMEYCDSLYLLYYGKTEKYFKSYNKLLQSEIRKFKHLLHRWFIELNDGDVIEIGQTWDDKLENPLDNYYDKGDYYIVKKHLVKDKELDAFISDDEEEQFLFNDYIKLPKSMVIKIFYKTEEKMI